MSRNKQNFRQAVKPNETGLPTVQAAVNAAPEQEEQLSTPETNPMDAVKPLEEDNEVVSENVVKMPEVKAEESSQSGFANYEKEQAQLAQAASAAQLTKEQVLAQVQPTARMSLLGVHEYINKNKTIGGTRQGLNSNQAYVTETGPALQVKLFRDIMDIITKTEDAEFVTAMNYLLTLFKQEAGDTLSLLAVSRYVENIKLNKVELSCYRNLMRMLTGLCNPATRSNDIRNIDMSMALQFGFNERARVRLLNYFKK